MQTLVNRKRPPVLQELKELKFPSHESVSLSNGQILHLVRAGSDPVCRLDIVLFGGRNKEEKKHLASSFCALLRSGSPKYSSAEIAEFLDFYGSSLSVSNGLDFSSIQLSCLSKHFSKSFGMLCHLLKEASFPTDEIELYQNRSFQRLKVNREKNDYLATRRFYEKAYGNQHVYGYRLNEEMIKSISQTDLIQFKNNLKIGEALVIFSGNYSDENLMELSNFLSAHPSGEKPKLQIPIPQAAVEDEFIEKADSHQCAIRIGRRAFNKRHEDFPEFVVMNTIFGGYFGSRLMSNIREEKGFTYGIYAVLKGNQNEGLYYITSDVGSKVYKEAISEVWKEMERMKNEKVPAEELKLVKNYIAGSLLGSIDGPFQIADSLMGFLLYGLDHRYFEKFFTSVREVSSEKIQTVAQDFFDSKQFFEVSVGSK